MMTRWMPMIVASIGMALLGCNNSGSSQARTVHGQINVSDYGLRQPVVLVESSSKAGYTAAVSATGNFSVAVPAGQSYRVTVADRTSTGALALVSRVLWSAKGKTFVWAKIANGSTLDFGVIRPLGATSGTSVGNAQGQNNDDQGENDDDQCDDNDDAQGDEQGQAGSSGSCQPPMGPPSNPPVCMPGSLGTSKGDRDQDCDQDDHDYGDDDRDDDGGAGAQCGDGGVMSGGDDDNQGDDNHQGNEDEDDGNGSGGQHCVTHVPTCPPASGGGTGGAGGTGGTGGAGGTTPPAGTPDMGTGGPIT
jgi:hypothetical protein